MSLGPMVQVAQTLADSEPISFRQNFILTPEAALAFELYKLEVSGSVLHTTFAERQDLAKHCLLAARDFLQVMEEKSQTIHNPKGQTK